MRNLTARGILESWERGQQGGPVQRALAVLAGANPDWSVREMAAMPVGRRDALLLELRRRTFGSELRGRVVCPSCRQGLHVDIDLGGFEGTAADGRLHTCSAEGYDVRFRLPTSEDLDAASRSGAVDEARAVLVRRCVSEIVADGEPRSTGDLPPSVVESIGARMEELDPLAEMPISLACASCDHEWLVLLDIGEFLWAEVARTAERVMYEVHKLADAFGWSEESILGMSSMRRQRYIDLLSR